MAQRRMFSLQVVNTDEFMEMPISSQALYFHLGMRADDDGFIDNSRSILRLIGASADDLRILIEKNFIIKFDSNIIVIRHWRLSNYIKKDRYRPTTHTEEISKITVDSGGIYNINDKCNKHVSKMDTEWNRSGTGMDTQVRLGKDRDRVSVGEDNSCGGGDSSLSFYAREGKDFPPMDEREKAEFVDFCAALFVKFASRAPTEEDRHMVFERICRREGSNVHMCKNNCDLLAYAFKQAVTAGKPGDWRYIDGVLAKLRERGLDTMEQVKAYEDGL